MVSQGKAHSDPALVNQLFLQHWNAFSASVIAQTQAQAPLTVVNTFFMHDTEQLAIRAST